MNKGLFYIAVTLSLTTLNVNATSISNNFGLSSPVSTITFDGVSDEQAISQFESLGLTGNILGEDTLFGPGTGADGLAGISGNHFLTRGQDGIGGIELNFTERQNAVAFAFRAFFLDEFEPVSPLSDNRTDITVSAFILELVESPLSFGSDPIFSLQSTLVSSFDTFTRGSSGQGDVFLGFENILFDRITVSGTRPEGNGSGLVGADLAVDNIQFGDQEISPVPVPAAAWLFGSGLMFLFGLRRRTLSATKAA